MKARSSSVAVASLLLAFLTITSAVPALAQEGMIRGTVTAADGTPLRGATVLIIGTVRGTNTSQAGEYALTVAAGVYVVRARLIGYEASERQVTVAAGATVTLDFQLAVGALLLDQVVVTGARTTRTVTETPSARAEAVPRTRYHRRAGPRGNLLASRLHDHLDPV